MKTKKPRDCAAAVLIALFVAATAAAQPEPPVPGDTPAAERTRTRLLKAKVEGDFQNAALRDILKEFAHQVDTQTDRPVLWTYADFQAGSAKVTFKCRSQPLDAALNELFARLKLGYFVISESDHPRDGWVRITMGNERGIGSLAKAAPKPGDEDEAKAAARLAVAREQLDKGRTAAGKAVLANIVAKFPKTKAAAEARSLLEKLDK